MGGARQRDHDKLRTVCLRCALHFLWLSDAFLILMAWRVSDGASLLYTTTQPTILNVLRQYTHHILFVPPGPANGKLDSTADA